MKLYVIAGNYQQFKALTPEDLLPHATFLGDKNAVAGLHGGVCLVVGTGIDSDLIAAARDGANMRIFYERNE